MSYYLNLSILSNDDDNPLLNKQDNLRKTEHKKRLSAEARHILSRCEGRPIAEEDIAGDTPWGRPFFPGRDTDFSISHSGNLAAVSLVRGKNQRTGCDVELVRPRPRAKEIAEEFFTAPERGYIESQGRFDGTRFFQIWTLKECFLKLRGLSVFDMPNAPSFICDEGQCRGRFFFSVSGAFPISFNLYELSGAGERYILATALEGTEIEQPEIRWFSQGSADCKSIANIKAAPSPAETVRPKI
ncbi:MAG: 4'-phosphopantetheinyl transferase superfamily protein [Spirochaetaceae bacterium]|jgi:phosphopantetheinyl transferase|nr:4'-phosphopantetheinyl transferase superfamily protein [Spirochaetaceae bacterium]